MNEEIVYKVLTVVETIPYGKVATYGQIAHLIGLPNHARLVGKILSLSEYYGEYPCHRVVNAQGRLAPQFSEQKSLLLAENVHFKNAKHVDLRQHAWRVDGDSKK